MTSDKRMSDKRLEEIDRLPKCGNIHCCGLMAGFVDLRTEIDALRAELTAARTVEDGQVAEAVDWLRELKRRGDIWDYAGDLADLLTRLSAAKAEAERQIEDERTLQHQLASDLAVMAGKLATAERERDEARADVTNWQELFQQQVDRARAAEAKNATARADGARDLLGSLKAVRPEDVSDEMVEAAMNSYFDGVYSKSDAQTPVGDAFRRAIAAAIAAGGAE